jgi:hypothetical protein
MHEYRKGMDTQERCNEGIRKSNFLILFQKRPMDGRFWMLTIE